MAIPRSVVNTASTLYGGLEVAAKSSRGKDFTHATRELGPIGKRIHSFLQSGPENSLGRRAVTTARAVMDYRGRGLARLGDLLKVLKQSPKEWLVVEDHQLETLMV